MYRWCVSASSLTFIQNHFIAVSLSIRRPRSLNPLAAHARCIQRPLLPICSRAYAFSAMAKRKSLSKAAEAPAFTIAPIALPTFDDDPAPPPKRRASQRKVSQPRPKTGSTNPDKNANVLDGPEAFRASPDADEPDERINLAEAGMDVERQVKEEDNDSPLSEISDVGSPVSAKEAEPNGKASAGDKKGIKDNANVKPTPAARDNLAIAKEPQFLDPEAEGDEDADEEEMHAALSRPPPVHSDYLPLPWKGRLGYVSLLFNIDGSAPLIIRRHA